MEVSALRIGHACSGIPSLQGWELSRTILIMENTIKTPIRVRIENWGGRPQTDPGKVVSKVIDILPYKEAANPKYIDIKIGVGVDTMVRQAHLVEAWQYLLRAAHQNAEVLKRFVLQLSFCSASMDFDGRGNLLDCVVFDDKVWYQTRRLCKPFYIPTRVFIETSTVPLEFDFDL